MPRALLRTITATLLFACGGKGSEESAGSSSTADASSGSDGSSGASSGAPTTGTTGVTTGATTVSTTMSTTGEPGTSGPGTTAGTSGEPSTGGSGESTTEGASGSSSSSGGTTGGDAAEYAAFWWSGGLNHLIVRKFDAEHGRCTSLALAWPSQGQPGFAIALPSEWGVQSATIQQDIGDCLLNWQPAQDLAPANGGDGTVAFVEDPMMFCPPTVDVDVTLSFDAVMPWIPAEDVLSAVAVPVQGCE